VNEESGLLEDNIELRPASLTGEFYLLKRLSVYTLSWHDFFDW
jgi:hypothetical protein